MIFKKLKSKKENNIYEYALQLYRSDLLDGNEAAGVRMKYASLITPEEMKWLIDMRPEYKRDELDHLAELNLDVASLEEGFSRGWVAAYSWLKFNLNHKTEWTEYIRKNMDSGQGCNNPE